MENFTERYSFHLQKLEDEEGEFEILTIRDNRPENETFNTMVFTSRTPTLNFRRKIMKKFKQFDVANSVFGSIEGGRKFFETVIRKFGF